MAIAAEGLSCCGDGAECGPEIVSVGSGYRRRCCERESVLRFGFHGFTRQYQSSNRLASINQTCTTQEIHSYCSSSTSAHACLTCNLFTSSMYILTCMVLSTKSHFNVAPTQSNHCAPRRSQLSVYSYLFVMRLEIECWHNDEMS